MFGAWSILKGLQCLLQHSSTLPTTGEHGKEAGTPKDTLGGTKDAAVPKEPKSKDGSSAKAKETEKLKAERSDKYNSSVCANRRWATCKVHPGFSPLCVALSTHLVRLLTALMEDVHLESLSTGGGGQADTVSSGLGAAVPIDLSSSGGRAAEFTLYKDYLAVERARRILNVVVLPDLLFFLLGQSFKKAVVLLGKLDETMVENCDANSSSSDSNTFYEEDFSSSDDSNGSCLTY